MTVLGMLVGAALGDLRPGAEDAVVYATAFGESRALEAYLDSFPEASPTQFQTSIHPSGVQQALVGLNVRQAAVAGEGSPLAGKLRELRNRKEPNYTQQDAREIIDRNTDDENAAFMRLALSAMRFWSSRSVQARTERRAASTTPSISLRSAAASCGERPASSSFAALEMFLNYVLAGPNCWTRRRPWPGGSNGFAMRMEGLMPVWLEQRPREIGRGRMH